MEGLQRGWSSGTTEDGQSDTSLHHLSSLGVLYRKIEKAAEGINLENEILEQGDSRKVSRPPVTPQIFTFVLIWPLTYILDLWPHKKIKITTGHLPPKFDFKQPVQCKVMD